MVEKDGLVGYVSDHVDSSHVVEGRPDGGHVQVFDMPGEPGEDGPLYDVVIRDANEGDGWPVRASFGSFNSAREAAEFAANKSEDTGLPIWDPIESLEHSASTRERLRDADDDQ